MSMDRVWLEKALGLRFWLALVAQVVLILAIPVQAVYTQATGRTIALQTGPVDPYNPLQGYYMMLGYEIANPALLKTLPGWDQIAPPTEQTEPFASRSLFVDGKEFYVVLQAPEEAIAQPPKPWKPVAVSATRPTNLTDQQVALRGNYRRGQVSYGLEAYYIPEDQQVAINNDLRQSQAKHSAFIMEVRVGAAGQALPLSFWLGEHHYQF